MGPVNPIGKSRPLDQLHDERTGTVGFLDTVNRGDIGMIQRRERTRFAIEPGQALRILSEASGRTFIATSRPSFVSRARYTSPMPPAPSRADDLVGAERVPGARLIY